MAAFDKELQGKVSQTAEDFSKSLMELGSIVENKFSEVVRKSVLDLFASIIRRSPVDTGTYRASHSLANHEPGPDEGIIYLSKDKSEVGMAQSLAMTTTQGWTWKVGDGTIFIFNNLPYAEAIENGHSGQAPQGVYIQALTEAQGVIAANVAKLKASGFFK